MYFLNSRLRCHFTMIKSFVLIKSSPRNKRLGANLDCLVKHSIRRDSADGERLSVTWHQFSPESAGWKNLFECQQKETAEILIIELYSNIYVTPEPYCCTFNSKNLNVWSDAGI